MNRMQSQVADFHEKFGATIGTVPYEISERERALRAKLIMEEAVETAAALGFTVNADIFSDEAWHHNDPEGDIGSFTKGYGKPHTEDFVDGLADLLYVTFGAAVTAGVDIEPHFDEVHRANMTKENGGTRGDGKIMKPEGWVPPDHTKIMHRQIADEERWRINEGVTNGR